jgi:hypothetical protein
MMNEGFIFVLSLAASLDKYTTVYNMQHLASMVDYLVLRVENSNLILRNTRTEHYAPIMGDSKSVDGCVRSTLQSGVPSNKIVLSAPGISFQFTLEKIGGSTNGLGDNTTGEIANGIEYKKVGNDDYR